MQRFSIFYNKKVKYVKNVPDFHLFSNLIECRYRSIYFKMFCEMAPFHNIVTLIAMSTRSLSIGNL